MRGLCIPAVFVLIDDQHQSLRDRVIYLLHAAVDVRVGAAGGGYYHAQDLVDNRRDPGQVS